MKLNGSEIVVTFLGTGAAIPADNKFHSSFALTHPKGTILFDCGEGTQFNLRKYRVSTRKEFVIVISHFHSDHFLGLSGLLASFQLLGRQERVVIIGPEGIDELVQSLLEANYVRLEYELEILSIKPREKLLRPGYTLSAVKAIHEARALSFIFEEDGRPGKIIDAKIEEFKIPNGPLIGQLQKGNSIKIDNRIIKPDEVMGPKRRGRVLAYSGDTRPNLDFIKEIPKPCDLLIHEGTYPSLMIELAEERKHSTIKEAAEMAIASQVDMMMVTHISSRFTSQEFRDEVKQIKSMYEKIEIAKPGLQFIIPLPS
jgi:ribonuclease Z